LTPDFLASRLSKQLSQGSREVLAALESAPKRVPAVIMRAMVA